MITPEQIQVVAGYDGWEYWEESYTTSLDWLHPVAMRVMGELRKQPNAWNRMQNIAYACSIEPTNGIYIDLFTAVYDGIIFLNQLKQNK